MHWWDQHVEDLETTDLEEICHQVLDLYAQPVTATKDALVSPPPGAAPKVSHFSLFLGCAQPRMPIIFIIVCLLSPILSSHFFIATLSGSFQVVVMQL